MKVLFQTAGVVLLLVLIGLSLQGCGTAVPVIDPSQIENTEGKIAETGFGKYSVAEPGGMKRLFYVSRTSSKFVPALWRPAVGDTVSIDYYVRRRANTAKLVVQKMTLKKAGPNTVEISSPIKVTIKETGATGFKTTLDEYKDIPKKFTRHDGTRTVPAGWIPAPGEKAVIKFHKKEATFFGIAYLADEVKRLD